MGLLLLIVVGGILGWLTAIIMQSEGSRQIAINALAGMMGALIVGNAANGSIAWSGLSAVAFLLGCIGALAGIVIANVAPKLYGSEITENI
ncbi:GlsB/YeaQ/YmgE family stress response membrane protein [Qipengyuania atrilutea]|uniref:GlsB/YeaQ/YmgE family stress response membrane protein n=1 Tax=Qipengyuania atrilutea TaxID=2744473 RepID=A0A850H3L5_9SPHN|nr:GlsB/YeaQ/YmgE family stress response membrane protein [Actirhodobacter atriluteus]NVD45180.1 GlsB/YeaQ/YmgE family stress response membrane protein [Actirhodobacter atriluteus]